MIEGLLKGLFLSVVGAVSIFLCVRNFKRAHRVREIMVDGVTFNRNEGRWWFSFGYALNVLWTMFSMLIFVGGLFLLAFSIIE